jgi:hypothetical protein
VALRLPMAWSTTVDREIKQASCYGGVDFCVTVARRFHLRLIEPVADLLCRLEGFWIGRRVETASVDSLRRHQFPAFIKSLDYALFPSRVYTSVHSFQRRCGTIDPNTPVLISEVVEFIAEIRTLVCDGEMVSLCPYHRSATSFTSSATQFGRQAAKDIPLPEVCVLDIGLLPNGSWAVVEANPVWAANPLGLDLRAFVECLRRSSHYTADA